MQSRQHAVAATTDVASGTHRAARSAGKSHTVTLVQLHISLPKLRSGTNRIRCTFARRIGLREHTQVQNRAIRIVSEKVFVAMSTAAHRRPQSRIHNPLKSIGRVFSALAYLDSAHSVRLRGWPAKVMSLFQRVVTRILSENGNRHIAPLPTPCITIAGTNAHGS